MGAHIGRRRLMELLGKDEPTREDVEEILEHLLEACPTCRAELDAIVKTPAHTGGWAAVVQASLDAAAGKLSMWERFRLVAPAEASELLSLSPLERRAKIDRALRRFKNPLLVDLLLDECKQRITKNPFEAYEIAECAQAIAMRLPHHEVGSAVAMTALARANAWRANALRVIGQFRQAQGIMEGAVALFERDGTGDPHVEGELLEQSATLYRDQRRFAESEACLDAAFEVYTECEERQLQGRVLVSKAMVLFEMNRTAEALDVVTEALPLISRDDDPWLFMSAVHNRAYFFAELGDFAEAGRSLEEHEALYASFSDIGLQLRRQWLEGTIAHGLGNRGQAERILVGVRHAFTNAGLGYDAALVGLDLALLYIEDGRTRDVAELALEMVPVFMAQDIHREAAAAVMLFQEAARQEAVTENMLHELIAYLRRVRAKPQERPS